MPADQKNANRFVLIVDYGMGNAGSVKNALEYLHIDHVLSAKAEDFKKATHIILPGVGSFDQCMKNLKKAGLFKLLEKEVLTKEKPYLGICLGMQILAEYGLEGGKTAGLGWVKGNTDLMRPAGELALPHVGWNDVKVEKRSLFEGIKAPIFYFVHSYSLEPSDRKAIAGTTDYGGDFVSAVETKNIYGVQFHPEKSQHAGLKLLENFLNK
ncbi:MAG: imidazole glycerol phosphate synthase subunit HisH [Candidatus Taylorbacteria bacterium]|nr:imidazole glycerol phosphate synthase subunit HisH [Candidatus Taylorbacteria bacterium]